MSTQLLPATPRTEALSTDLPSGLGVRPFGLSRTSPVPADSLLQFDGTCYDPEAQTSVLPGSGPAATPDRIIRMGTTYDTRYDNQWFADKD